MLGRPISCGIISFENFHLNLAHLQVAQPTVLDIFLLLEPRNILWQTIAPRLFPCSCPARLGITRILALDPRIHSFASRLLRRTRILFPYRSYRTMSVSSEPTTPLSYVEVSEVSSKQTLCSSESSAPALSGMLPSDFLWGFATAR